MRLSPVYAALLFGFCAFPQIATALNLDFLQRFCPQEITEVPPLDEWRQRFPVGCEVVDCCPGCPGPGIFEWRINVGANYLAGAELRFDKLDASNLKQLKLSGNAKLDGNRIVLGRGASRISGLPGNIGGAIPIVSLAPIADKDAAAKLKSSVRPGTGGKDPDAGSIKDSIAVRQFVGGFEVNRFRSRYFINTCFPPPSPNDRIRAQNIVGGDNVVVMLDARTSAGAGGCGNDQVLRTTSERNVGNLLASAGCNSEVAVFGANNAMSWQTAVASWTNAAGDLHTAALQPVINAPVTVWIANAGAAAQAVNDVANANLLFAQNKVGIQFTPTYNNISGNDAAVATIGTASCGAVGAIRGSAWYTANRLNIYYVNGAFTGENCARTAPVGDGNISYIGTLANIASLVHEIGHAFGLRPAGSGGHTNTVAGFGNNNIMWGGGPPGRNHFSLGQAFRMNTHTDIWGGTMLITDGLRAGPGRACPPLTTSNICPALGLDWARP